MTLKQHDILCFSIKSTSIPSIINRKFLKEIIPSISKFGHDIGGAKLLRLLGTVTLTFHVLIYSSQNLAALSWRSSLPPTSSVCTTSTSTSSLLMITFQANSQTYYTTIYIFVP